MGSVRFLHMWVVCRCKLSAVIAASIAPLAPSVCPINDFVEFIRGDL